MPPPCRADSPAPDSCRSCRDEPAKLDARNFRGNQKTEKNGHHAAAIKAASARSLHVCFICHLAEARSTSFHEISRVQFRRLGRGKIDNYLARVNPLRQGGAYAAQGFAAKSSGRSTASYTNVIGLPIEKTIPALAEFGLAPKR